MKMENRVGAMTHPCLTPLSTLKASVSSPLPLSAVADMWSCSSLSTRMYFWAANLCQNQPEDLMVH